MIFAKLDSGLHRNPKIVAAGPDAREVFVFLLCLNAELNAGGEMSSRYVRPEYLARQLDRSVTSVTEAVTSCVRERLIEITGAEGETVRLVGWGDEWGRATKSNAERQRSWRDKRRVTERNAPAVTDNASNASEEKRIEEKRGEETLSSDLPVGAPKARRKRPSVSLPADWTPKGEAPPRELERFKLHAQTNDRRCVDWDAAWRMWLSKAADFQRAGPTRSGPPLTPFELQMQRVAELEALEKQGAS